jgi:hypothetical protein
MRDPLKLMQPERCNLHRGALNLEQKEGMWSNKLFKDTLSIRGFDCSTKSYENIN